MTLSMLLTSCATPPASCPIACNFCPSDSSCLAPLGSLHLEFFRVYTAFFFSSDGHLFTYSLTNLLRTLPTMKVMIGLLRRSSNDLFTRLQKSEGALRHLNNELERRVEERRYGQAR
jgi:hypothetical protein